MFRRIGQVVFKEFIQVWRDRRLRIFLFLPPIIQLIIYGYAINFDIRQVPTAVFDESRSPESQELVSRFGATDYFRLRYYLQSEAEIRPLLDKGEVTLVLRLPPDFARLLHSGREAPVQLLIDATDSNAALVVAKYASMILTDYNQELLPRRLRQAGWQEADIPRVILEPRARFNPNLLSRIAFVPGVIAMVVMLVSLMLTALAVAREKEMGTLEQVLATPIRPVEFLIGKSIPFILISLGDVVLVTLVGIYWFEVPFRGSSLMLVAGTLTFLFNSVGLGLLISTVSANQQQAVTAGTFLLTPAIMLSGLIFPIANMPVFFQYLTYINPLRYFVTVVQGIFLRGDGLLQLWPDMAAMTGLGVLMLTFGVLRFRTRLA